MKYSIFLLTFFIFFYCCSYSPQTTNPQKYDFQTDSLAILWRADSTGFGKGKQKSNLDTLFNRYQMQDLTCKEIIDILGQPVSKIKNYQNCHSLIYYFDGHYWDENGDGRIDSTTEFEKHAVYFELKNSKWERYFTT